MALVGPLILHITALDTVSNPFGEDAANNELDELLATPRSISIRMTFSTGHLEDRSVEAEPEPGKPPHTTAAISPLFPFRDVGWRKQREVDVAEHLFNSGLEINTAVQIKERKLFLLSSNFFEGIRGGPVEAR